MSDTNNYLATAEVGADLCLTENISLRNVTGDIYGNDLAPGAWPNDFRLTSASPSRFKHLVRPKTTSAWAAGFLGLCLLGQVPCPAQSTSSDGFYAQPAWLKLKGDKKTPEEGYGRWLLREEFYPIGWSKDGELAYYVEPADEACGCYLGHLVIQDLRTDKVVWEVSYESGIKETEHDLESYWAKNQKTFSAKLARYGIVAQKQFTRQNSAINYRSDLLTPTLKVDTKVTNDGRVSGSILLQLLSRNRGRKTIYEKNFDPKEYSHFREAELSGSLSSPFEPRVAVIMIETHRGWEGPPNITRIRIVGATLITGFH